MKNPLFRRLFLFLAIMGPGIITSNVDNDAGGITTYSVAGAALGYKILWLFLPMIVALVVIQEMCTRMGAVTGKGLADLIRERFGVRITFYAMVGLLLGNLGNIMSEFAGVAASMELFGITKYLSLPLAALFTWWLVLRWSYKVVERVFLAACLVYFSYIFSGYLAHPDWGMVAKELVIPSFSFDSHYLVIVVGLIGTTIAPWMQFYIQSATVEKGITVKDYTYTKYDVIVGSIMVNLVAVFIVISCAAALHTHGIKVDSAKEAALALAPLAGPWASTLFAIGLLNASLFSASILPLSTAYFICEAFGIEAGIDKSWGEAPAFYWLYTILIIIGAGFILIPNIPLIKVMFWSQVLNGVMLPFVLIFMLSLINNKDIMGDHVNGRTFNIIAWVTVVIMIVLTLIMVGTSLFQS
ncbi:MAG: Nramp family divalent metal transporter [Syntrophobacterales bacterium]|nr:Nramp family divalent metal transporter [Syntrophobacterales bacterium]